jgi:hypothetical protein
VLFCLYRRGILAALAPPGVPEVDILVLDAHRKVAASIQVKTRTGLRGRGWVMNAKNEFIGDPNLFYALVDLGPEHPVTYIVPSAAIARVLHLDHLAFLSHPGIHGQVHKDNSVRRLLPSYKEGVAPGVEDGWLEDYREGWDAVRAGAGRGD